MWILHDLLLEGAAAAMILNASQRTVLGRKVAACIGGGSTSAAPRGAAPVPADPGPRYGMAAPSGGSSIHSVEYSVVTGTTQRNSTSSLPRFSYQCGVPAGMKIASPA